MYHDEFGRKSPWSKPVEKAPAPDLAMQLGGGLTLGLAASLDQTISTYLYILGGVIPLVTCSIGIFAHRCSEVLARFAPKAEVEVGPRSVLPAAHTLHTSSPVSASGPHRGFARSESVRAGFDRSGRLG